MNPQRLPSESELYKQVLESLTSGVIAVDLTGRILASNPPAASLLDTEPESLAPGQSLRALSEPGGFLDIIDEMRHTGEPVMRREILREQGNHRQYIGVTASMLENAGEFQGAIFLFSDLTHVRELERAALINRQLAQIGELTAGVVHELRNPLSIINGMAELLSRDLKGEDRQHRKAEAIRQEVHHLESLVRQFLLFARPFEYRPQTCAVREILDRVMALCAAAAAAKQVELRVVEAPDLTFTTDPDMLSRALGNIAANAVEVSPEKGRVSLDCRREGERLRFRIEDEGPGIHLAENEDIFSPFFSKKAGGTGLGLSIVHRIITALEGEVLYGNRGHGESGAWFEIRLPVSREITTPQT
jgi:two-component system, NtrC family, sensor histidine kinase AtoS